MTEIGFEFNFKVGLGDSVEELELENEGEGNGEREGEGVRGANGVEWAKAGSSKRDSGTGTASEETVVAPIIP